MSRLTLLCLLALSLLLNGCGFHLRGSVGYPAQSIYIKENGAARMAMEIGRNLQDAGVTIPEKAQEADLVLHLTDEVIDRRVLSVSAITGKLEEVELNYRISLAIDRPDGSPLIAPQTISLLRDYSFEETAVLAKGEEELVLREELFRDALAQITRRLQMVQVPPKAESEAAETTEADTTETDAEPTPETDSVTEEKENAEAL